MRPVEYIPGGDKNVKIKPNLLLIIFIIFSIFNVFMNNYYSSSEYS